MRLRLLDMASNWPCLQVISLIMLINLTGQLCQFVDPLLIQQQQQSSSSSSSSSSDVSSDSTMIISDSSVPSSSFSASSSSSSSSSTSSSASIETSLNEDNQMSTNKMHKHGSKKRRYQPARYLVRPFWLNPKYTWKAFQMNSSRNEAKDEEIRKIREKKRAKIRKLMDKIKKAALISKKLYLLLNDISVNLDPELI